MKAYLHTRADVLRLQDDEPGERPAVNGKDPLRVFRSGDRTGDNRDVEVGA